LQWGIETFEDKINSIGKYGVSIYFPEYEVDYEDILEILP
jgi:hypothetical protein